MQRLLSPTPSVDHPNVPLPPAPLPPPPSPLMLSLPLLSTPFHTPPPLPALPLNNPRNVQVLRAAGNTLSSNTACSACACRTQSGDRFQLITAAPPSTPFSFSRLFPTHHFSLQDVWVLSEAGNTFAVQRLPLSTRLHCNSPSPTPLYSWQDVWVLSEAGNASVCPA